MAGKCSGIEEHHRKNRYREQCERYIAGTFPGEILSKVQSSGEKRQDQRLYTIDMPDEGTDLHQTVMECTQDIQCH